MTSVLFFSSVFRKLISDIFIGFHTPQNFILMNTDVHLFRYSKWMTSLAVILRLVYIGANFRKSQWVHASIPLSSLPPPPFPSPPLPFLPSPTLPFPFLSPSLTLPFPPSLPLEVGPLKYS